jgi:hypothetical protein
VVRDSHLGTSFEKNDMVRGRNMSQKRRGSSSRMKGVLSRQTVVF